MVQGYVKFGQKFDIYAKVNFCNLISNFNKFQNSL